jgi:hypothetical protein
MLPRARTLQQCEPYPPSAGEHRMMGGWAGRVRCTHRTVGGPSAESYAMQEIGESRVAAQRVKSWINV